MNIALTIVRDVQTLAPDNVIVMSGDIDLLPALDVIMAIDKKVKPVIYIPVHEAMLKYRKKDEFMKYGQTVKPIPEKYLRMAHFAPKRVMVMTDPNLTNSPVVETDCKALKEQGIDASGYRLMVNVNQDGGQEVFHLHMHLLGGRNLGPMLAKKD